MPYVRHKLGKTFFVVKGRSVGTPIIFLHGGPGGRHDWNKPILNLSKNRKVYLYDQIGGGKSSPIPKKHWKIKTFVDELEVLVKKWNLKEFHLCGGSWGTTVALEYYLRTKGSGVKSLVFISPMFSTFDWKRDAQKLIGKLPLKTKQILRYCQKIGATDSKVYRSAMMDFYLKHVLRDKQKLKTLMKKFSGGHGNGKKIYEYMWGPSEFEPVGTLRKYDRVNSLKRISVPTLFMCGEYDEATPSTTNRYHNLVPGSEFKILKGCSHASLVENPKIVLKRLVEFLGD